jgi:hypothetical protein
MRRRERAGNEDGRLQPRREAVEQRDVLRFVPEAPGRQDAVARAMHHRPRRAPVVHDARLAPQAVLFGRHAREGAGGRDQCVCRGVAGRDERTLPGELLRQRRVAHRVPPGGDAGVAADHQRHGEVTTGGQRRAVQVHQRCAGILRKRSQRAARGPQRILVRACPVERQIGNQHPAAGSKRAASRPGLGGADGTNRQRHLHAGRPQVPRARSSA